ncbi:hypothetical protein BCV69DRAFT_132957 [Microstroma glucosiphilum]|uniref:Uncharacterized protein n=1 Tax=Pseudomicrostroma glucosiphilum TaxID=1684307 RepID=A0A316UA74_9BASI|nr:hypothetical protein BCV69DRAFT_132957 [Pseudomicrostroma glucosiphilum]PWN22106.1 hypothetical protein BCV69DRAFT_132957 [Pseudomicrostroma glucosiphilum]
MDAHKGSRTVLALQIVALILIHGVVGAAAYRQFAKGARARNNTIALSFSAKSIIIIFYELLTEHVRALQRWRSLKAYMILSCMEVVFWIAVPVLMVMAWVKDHWKGTTAILGGVIVGLGSVIA